MGAKRDPTPARLAFVTQPSNVEGQEPISPAVEVEVQNAGGERVSGSTANVTVRLASDPTERGATLSGTVNVDAAGGVATFSDLSIALPAEGYELEATSGGLASATSDSFAVRVPFDGNVGTKEASGAKVSAAVFHTCGVTVSNHVYCWGVNGSGQLGDGTTESSLTPVPVSGGLSFVEVRTGHHHTCGVTTDNDAYCWGSNTFGQLGDGTTTDRTEPVPVSGGLSFRRVTAGEAHTCGVTTTDEAYCWGKNSHGQLGDSTTTDRTEPVPVVGGHTFERLSAGELHTCGMADPAGIGPIYCWGNNTLGQLGDSTTTGRVEPVQVRGDVGDGFLSVDAGRNHTCGKELAGPLWCWGQNLNGQLGDGTTANRVVPVKVEYPDPRNIGIRYSAGARHTCDVSHVNEKCWGSNTFGELGDGTNQPSLVPVAISAEGQRGGVVSFEQISAGEGYTCAVSGSNPTATMQCWGKNSNGQLGDGTLTDRLTPVRVTGSAKPSFTEPLP